MAASQHSVGGLPIDTNSSRRSFPDVLAAKPSFSPAIASHPYETAPLKMGLHKGQPAAFFTDQQLQGLSTPYSWSLVGKFSQGYNKSDPTKGRPSLDHLHCFFLTLDFKGEFSLGLLDNRHVIIHLSTETDYLRLYSLMVWYIGSVTMRVFRWSPYFRVDKESPLVPVWITMPRLPIMLFDQKTLFSLASLIGRPLRRDDATVHLKRPSVARIQVELDLLKPRPEQIWIGLGATDGYWQHIEYESIPDYCQKCWHVGHAEGNCRVDHPHLKSQPKQATVPVSAALQRLHQIYVPKVPQPSSAALVSSLNLEHSDTPTDPLPTASAAPVLPTIVSTPTAAMAVSSPDLPLTVQEIGFPPVSLLVSPTVASAVDAPLSLASAVAADIVATPVPFPTGSPIPLHDSVTTSPVSMPATVSTGLLSMTVDVVTSASLFDVLPPIVTPSLPQVSAATVSTLLMHHLPSPSLHVLPAPPPVTALNAIAEALPVVSEAVCPEPPSVQSVVGVSATSGLQAKLFTEVVHALPLLPIMTTSTTPPTTSYPIATRPSEFVVHSPTSVATTTPQQGRPLLSPHAEAFLFPTLKEAYGSQHPPTSSAHAHIFMQDLVPPALGTLSTQHALGYSAGDYSCGSFDSDNLDDEESSYDITEGSEGTVRQKRRDQKLKKAHASSQLVSKEVFEEQSRSLGKKLKKRGRPPGSRNRTFFDVVRTMETRASKSSSS